MKKKEQKLARVTSVLSFLNSAWLQYWYRKVGFQEADRISRESQEFGKAVHRFAEGYFKTVLEQKADEEIYALREGQCGNNLITWFDENKVKPLYLEQELKDTKIGLIGHCD